MITVTYIITVYNKAKYIAGVINSLKAISGDFRKEFIIIDDGSKDDSLAVIESASSDLARTTVITQQNQGPAISINKGISLAHGDYIHFVDGDDVVANDATILLLKACKDLGVEVAYGLRGKCHYETMTLIPSKRENGEILLIDSPIKMILEASLPNIRCIGSSGSLVSRSLLEKISGADIAVFVQDLSISLRCAKYSKFAFVSKTASYSPFIYDKNNLSYDKEFEAYNTLQAISNFIATYTEIASRFKPELHRALWSTVWKLNKCNATNLPRYLLAKYTNRDISIEDLQTLYNSHIKTLLYRK